MAKMLLYLLFGACLFLLATAAWLPLHQRAAQSLASEQAAAAADPLAVASANSATAAAQAPAAEMPVALRGRPMSPEEVFRFGATIRNQQEALVKRAEAVHTEQARLKLIHDDLQGEQQELEGLFAQIQDSLASGEQLLKTIQQHRADLDAHREAAREELDDFKEARVEYVDLEVDNVKQISRWFQSMPPEKAAECLRELSNDGKMASAIQVLGNIEERDVAKILGAMEDPALVVQLTEQFKGLKRPPKKKRR